MMRSFGAALIAATLIFVPNSACIAFEQQAAGSNAPALRGPPLETSVAGNSENGRSQMVVTYHADGRFDMREVFGNGWDGRALVAHTGRWWWAREGEFCWVYLDGRNPGKEICKTNGHLIGSVDYAGRSVSKY